MAGVNESLLDSAYSNIGLDANTIWRDVQGDRYQKCSDKLWVKLNYLKEKKHHQVGGKGKVVTVRDVIPQSRLAQYGNFSYDNDREMIYNREKPGEKVDEERKIREQGRFEPWMLPEVENEFRRLTRNCAQPYDLYNGFKPVDCIQIEESIKQKYPMLTKRCQPIVIDPEETLEIIQLPNPFYRIEDLNQLELQMRVNSTRYIWENPLRNSISILTTQISPNNHCLRAIPFNQVEQAIGRKILRLKHPSTSSPPGRVLDNGDRRWSAKNQPRAAESSPKKRSSGDLTNLTLLTRPVNLHGSHVPDYSNMRVPESVLKWLQSDYPTRSKEFHAIQNLNCELRNVRVGVEDVPCQDRSRIEDPHDRKTDSMHNPFLEALVRKSENLFLSQSSGSSSGHSRPEANSARPIRSTGIPRKQFSPFSNLSYSPISSGSWQSPNSQSSQNSPYNEVSCDDVTQRFNGKPKCRPILSSQCRDFSDENDGQVDKRRVCRELWPAGGQ